jgi:hypothetical protein
MLQNIRTMIFDIVPLRCVHGTVNIVWATYGIHDTAKKHELELLFCWKWGTLRRQRVWDAR